MTEDEIYAELAVLTKLSAADWQDFVACSPADQALMVDTYRTLDWAQSPDVVAKVIALLTILGTIAGVVTGVAGAAAAIRTLAGS